MNVVPVLDQNDARQTSSAEADDPSRNVRTQLLRRIAHDIASPAGVALTVLEEIAASERARPELVGMARRSLKRLMRLSEHLALVSELEAEMPRLELGSVDVRVVAKQAIDDAVAIDGRKEIAVSSDVASAPLIVEGDPRLLHVVFREVVGNALRIASSQVQVQVSSGQDAAGRRTAAVRVDDDGPGFPPESLELLGRRFVRRQVNRGLGLSLSMAVDILEAHGGALSVGPSVLPPGRRGVSGAAVVATLPLLPNARR